MATDVAPPDRSEAPATLPVPAAAHRRRGWLLVAAMAFNLWLWGTRIANLVGDPAGTPAPVVHGVLYTAAIGVALVVGAIGWRQVREARAPGRRT